MKTIVITGVTSGIGKELVHYFLSKGEQVIGIGRNPEKLSSIQNEFSALGFERFVSVKADFSVLKEVEEEGKKIASEFPDGIDALIHNAAIIPQKKEITIDHHEMQFQVNYLAAVQLTHCLIPLLSLKKGKVVTTTSMIHKVARFNPKNIEAIKPYFLLKSYSKTKLYNILFARGMNEFVYPSTGIYTYTIDPGLVKTGIMEKHSNGFFRWAFRSFTSGGINPEQIGENYGYLLYDCDIGNHYSYCNKLPNKVSKAARSDKARDLLWEATNRMLSISYPEKEKK